MRYFLLMFILSLSFLSSTLALAEHNCLDKCIARGGLPQACDKKCGVKSYRAGGEKKPAIIRQGDINGVFNLDSQPEDTSASANSDAIGDIIMQALQYANSPEGQARKEAMINCYESRCKTAASDLPLEQCIRNCAQASIFDSSGGINISGGNENNATDIVITNPTLLIGDFKDVDFDCFKACRAAEQSLDECKILCKRSE